MDFLAVIEVVQAVDAVDEDHARLGVGVGRAHDLFPQLPRRQGLPANAVEHQIPRLIVAHRFHEGVAHQHREVEHPQPAGLVLGLDEGLDVGMIAAHGRHHGATPRARAHDGAAHGIPNIHEGKWSRGIGADAFHRRPLGPQRREIVADTAALLHGQRRFLEVLEDAAHVIGDGAHDETIEKRDVPGGAGAGDDAPGRQEFETLERLVEAFGPILALFFRLGQGVGDAPPAIVDGFVHRRAIGRFEAVFHVPDLLGYRYDAGHDCSRVNKGGAMLPGVGPGEWRRPP